MTLQLWQLAREFPCGRGILVLSRLGKRLLELFDALGNDLHLGGLDLLTVARYEDLTSEDLEGRFFDLDADDDVDCDDWNAFRTNWTGPPETVGELSACPSGAVRGRLPAGRG